MPTAIITGANGQDARLLTALLAGKNWEVVATVRPGKASQLPGCRVVEIDLHDRLAVGDLVRSVRPTHIFHLAACHHSSEQEAIATTESEMVATNFYAAELMLSAAIRLGSGCRFLCAGSSQMYTRPESGILVVDEQTPMHPSTFYGYSKMWCRQLVDHYRKKLGVHASMCILFNHESRLRPPSFLSRKISMAAARAKLGLGGGVRIHNIAARVDWSSAEDIVSGMLAAASSPVPDDYVLSFGIAQTVEHALGTAFTSVGLSWKDHVTFDSNIASGTLVGDSSKARTALGWIPRLSIDEVLRDMVQYDIEVFSRDQRLAKHSEK